MRQNYLFVLAIGAATAFSGGCATTKDEVKVQKTAEDSPPPQGPTVTSEQNDAIDALFRRKAPELQSCWQDEYQRTKNRKLEGDISVQMLISPQGHAGDVKIASSTIGVPAVDECVVKSIGAWSFPEGPAPAPYRRTVHLGAEY
ncbi:MAG: AgmX/PglI C-terminal domain-containing protein [Polyangia bacterium]